MLMVGASTHGSAVGKIPPTGVLAIVTGMAVLVAVAAAVGGGSGVLVDEGPPLPLLLSGVLVGAGWGVFVGAGCGVSVAGSPPPPGVGVREGMVWKAVEAGGLAAA